VGKQYGRRIRDFHGLSHGRKAVARFVIVRHILSGGASAETGRNNQGHLAGETAKNAAQSQAGRERAVKKGPTKFEGLKEG